MEAGAAGRSGGRELVAAVVDRGPAAGGDATGTVLAASAQRHGSGTGAARERNGPAKCSRVAEVCMPAASVAARSAREVAVEPSEDREVEHPSRLNELGVYIRQQRESARLSLRKLATLAGVSNPYLSQIERGLRKPSAEILQAIAKALEISSETLYIKAGILEEREPEEDLLGAISRDPYLTDPQRQALQEMYRSFRALSELTGERPPRRRGLLDRVGTGDVDDDAIEAAAHPEEDAGPL